MLDVRNDKSGGFSVCFYDWSAGSFTVSHKVRILYSDSSGGRATKIPS